MAPAEHGAASAAKRRRDTLTTETTHTGGCLCGAVRYRATAPPVRGVLCHCSMCRRHSGAPVLGFVMFPAPEFEWLGEPPAGYRSSAGAARQFCPTCGSTVGMREDALPDLVQVSVGSLDEPGRASIDEHVFVEERIAWFEVADRLPRHPRGSPADPARHRT